MRAVVLGAGVTGRSAARFLLDRCARVDVYDDAPAEKLGPDALALQDAGARVLAGGPPLDPGAYDLAVLSPGIAVDSQPVQALARGRVEVIGEVELAARFLDAPILAVTGTNGKTTTTELLGQILRAQGRKVFVGGNVGTPLVDAVGERWDLVVAEVSSFQLETIRVFRPRVAVLLNVTDDHFDRHRDLAAYARAKARVFENQGPGDTAIVNRDDPVAWSAARGASSMLVAYSTRAPVESGAWAEAHRVVFRLGSDEVSLDRQELALPGVHNVGNALAACLAAVRMGADLARAWAEAGRFRGLPHRIQTFLEWRGIRFVDDSKGTNVGAAVEAIDTVRGPIVWVAGGVDKGGDYGPLAARLRGRARRMVLVGAAARKMAEALGGAASITVARDWPEAVREAVGSARPGDTVLLSPACSSFDFFRSYAERGDVFQKLCREETRRLDSGES